MKLHRMRHCLRISGTNTGTVAKVAQDVQWLPTVPVLEPGEHVRSLSA